MSPACDFRYANSKDNSKAIAHTWKWIIEQTLISPIFCLYPIVVLWWTWGNNKKQSTIASCFRRGRTAQSTCNLYISTRQDVRSQYDISLDARCIFLGHGGVTDRPYFIKRYRFCADFTIAHFVINFALSSFPRSLSHLVHILSPHKRQGEQTRYREFRQDS